MEKPWGIVEEQQGEKGQWGKGCWVVELGTCEVIRKEIVGVINLLSTLALTGSSSSLHSEACNALGASDGVIHSSISHLVSSL